MLCDDREKPLPARELEPQERLDWLRLCRTDTIGPVSFYALLRQFGSAGEALAQLPQLGRRGLKAMPRVEAEREVGALDRIGAAIVCWG